MLRLSAVTGFGRRVKQRSQRTLKFQVNIISLGSAVFTLPLVPGGTYDFTVNWGDGNTDDITAYSDTGKEHEYASTGTYDVEIDGVVVGWAFGSWSSSAYKILEVSNWGELLVSDAGEQFASCNGMTWIENAIGGPKTSHVTNMESMFNACDALNQSINHMDTSSVINTVEMFYGCDVFNQPVRHFDTSLVTDFSRMFSGCAAFDQDVSEFDTSSATALTAMFWGAVSFDQDISGFDVSSVTDMNGMFNGVTLSTVNYDALILAFSAGVPSGPYPFDGGGSKYTPGGVVETARDAWTAKGWTITDGGPVT